MASSDNQTSGLVKSEFKPDAGLSLAISFADQQSSCRLLMLPLYPRQIVWFHHYERNGISNRLNFSILRFSFICILLLSPLRRISICCWSIICWKLKSDLEYSYVIEWPVGESSSVESVLVSFPSRWNWKRNPPSFPGFGELKNLPSVRRGPARTTFIKCYLKAGAFFSISFTRESLSKWVSCSVFALHLLLKNSWQKGGMLRKNFCYKYLPCETLLLSMS